MKITHTRTGWVPRSESVAKTIDESCVRSMVKQVLDNAFYDTRKDAIHDCKDGVPPKKRRMTITVKIEDV